MAITAANQIVSQPVTWLWQDRLPLGKLVMLDGDPDLGKSLLALDWCARLSTGRPFPEGEAVAGPANALVLSGEDSAADTIVPRLERLGADMQRVFVWQRETEDEEWPWRFPRQADRLDDALSRTDARLAVIDPLMAFLDDSVLYASDQSVRRALTPLMQVAEKRRCTLLMHRHLNKQGSQRAMYRGLGSIAFVAVCRFAMLVERDPHVPGRNVLAQVRHSLSKPQPSLAYQIASGDGSLPTVEWLGVSTISADELLAGNVQNRRDKAAAFLRHFLAGGPRTAREIWQVAKGAGHTARTLRRAKGGLDIRCRRVHTEGRTVTYWLLPDQELPGGEDEIDRFLRQMEKEFPPRTPLEEEESE